MNQPNKKMKTFKIILPLLVLLLSCEKEDVSIDIKSNRWVVEKMKSQGEHTFTKAGESYVLEFTSDTTYTLKLDVNSCFGYYEIINSGNITISLMACTKICCDSDFAVDLSQLFPKMTEYYGKGDNLIFEGEGEIVLKINDISNKNKKNAL